MKNPTIFADGGECFSLKSIINHEKINHHKGNDFFSKKNRRKLWKF